ncbi:MAG: spermidine synthase [Bacteroidales bacterium]
MYFFKKIYDLFFGQREVLETTKSSVNQYLEVVKEKKRLVLNSKNVNYSFGGLHFAFKELFGKIEIPSSRPLRVLILGYGAGSVAEILNDKISDQMIIDGVEIDSEILRLAEKYFNLNSTSNLTLYCEDAYDFVMNNKKSKYDLIVVDLYKDFEVPMKFKEEIFLHKLIMNLTDRGLMIYNKLLFSQKDKVECSKIIDVLEKFNSSELRIIKIGGAIKHNFICFLR